MRIIRGLVAWLLIVLVLPLSPFIVVLYLYRLNSVRKEANKACESLGLPRVPVKIENKYAIDMGNDLARGYYNFEDQYINIALFNTRALITTRHECRHYWQSQIPGSLELMMEEMRLVEYWDRVHEIDARRYADGISVSSEEYMDELRKSVELGRLGDLK